MWFWFKKTWDWQIPPTPLVGKISFVGSLMAYTKKRNYSFGVFHGSYFFLKRSEYAPWNTFYEGKKKIAVPAKTSAKLQNLKILGP